ncbi:hypothetical protein [Hanstruepera ponticola]|uniref:hypothetical protein n=1 Tax=Hanstruepera ponticola TaxID=2042995 RepID=UPI000CF0F11F|nr:hypothetical protein [Hanstruepera ponticola]
MANKYREPKTSIPAQQEKSDLLNLVVKNSPKENIKKLLLVRIQRKLKRSEGLGYVGLFRQDLVSLAFFVSFLGNAKKIENRKQ